MARLFYCCLWWWGVVIFPPIWVADTPIWRLGIPVGEESIFNVSTFGPVTDAVFLSLRGLVFSAWQFGTRRLDDLATFQICFIHIWSSVCPASVSLFPFIGFVSYIPTKALQCSRIFLRAFLRHPLIFWVILSFSGSIVFPVCFSLLIFLIFDIYVRFPG